MTSISRETTRFVPNLEPRVEIDILNWTPWFSQPGKSNNFEGGRNQWNLGENEIGILSSDLQFQVSKPLNITTTTKEDNRTSIITQATQHIILEID